MGNEEKMGIVTDEDIVQLFAGTNFGDRDHRKVLEQGVLKQLGGYKNGHTLECIMRCHDLTTAFGDLTDHGKRFLFNAFKKRP